jgi:HEAT repeat protein
MGNHEAVPALIIRLNDNDRFVRRRAVMLNTPEQSECFVPLMNALHDPERKVRYRFAEALERLVISKPPLLNTLNDPSRTVRRKVIIALGLIGSEEAVAPITWRLRDTSSQVRSAAEHVLKHQFNPSRPGMRKYRSRNKICPHCHKPVIPNTNYCPSCGASLS